MSVVDNAIYVDGRRKLAPASLDTAFSALRSCPDDGRSFAWIGMLRPGRDEIDAVAHEFDLHELAVEDTVNQHQRPKLERYGDTTFVVLRPARYVDPVEVIKLGELHLFLGPEFAITVRHADEPDLAVVRKCLEDDPELLAHGPYAVLWGCSTGSSTTTARCSTGSRTTSTRSRSRSSAATPAVSKRIYQLTREVIAFHRAVEPLRGIFTQLRWQFGKNGDHTDVELRRRDARRRGPRHARAGARRELPGAADQPGQRAGHPGRAAAERGDGPAHRGGLRAERAGQADLVVGGDRFAPTLVAGIYGMNFDHMPELHWTLGYPFAVLLMVLAGGLLWVLFKRNDWL